MMLEYVIGDIVDDSLYPFDISESDQGLCLDWEPMIRHLIEDMENLRPIGEISAAFHNTLAEMIVAVSDRLREDKVLLTGGCFQNRYLSERTIRRLRESGHTPYWHHRVPPNDGGIALGQIMAANRIFWKDK
jgi:hydrogenase maturation protein HypF